MRTSFGSARKTAAIAVLLLAAVSLTGCSSDNSHCPLTNAQVGGGVNGTSSVSYKASSKQLCRYTISGSSTESVQVQWVPYAGSGFRGEVGLEKVGYTPISATQAAQLGEPALRLVFPSEKSSPDSSSWIEFNHDGYAWAVGVVNTPAGSRASLEKKRAFALAQIISAEKLTTP